MSVSQSHPQARLADHVRACQVGDQMIFLDLRLSKYIGVGGPQLPTLSAAILGRPAIDGAQELPSNAAPLDEWIRRLRGQQLLADAPATELERKLPEPIEPIASLTMDDEDRAVDSEWHHLVRLWRATLVTAAWLRWCSLAGIADRVAALRARHSERGDGLAADAMHAEAARYMHLRPFALTTHDRCLKDSLTLIHFLATQGLFPRWVIGVRVHPFGAHSWVQSGGVVLNDLPERVRHYQPILIV
jgi:hypothetical protein